MHSYQTEAIRNVVLLGHSGDGKTTLTETLLHRTGGVSRLGRVEDGTTASDYEPEEHKRAGSVNLSVLPVEWRDHKINFLDSPGYMDFVGETLEAIRVADGAIIFADASSGPQVGTDMAWRRAEGAGIPRMVFLGKMDRENANFQSALEAVQARYGKNCVAFHLPIGSEQDFKGVVDILKRCAYLADGTNGDVPNDMLGAVEEACESLVEAVAETDDDLATKYLEGEEITPDELVKALHAAVKDAKVFPVLAGSGLAGHGIEAVLDAAVDLLPSPAEAKPAIVQSEDDESVTVQTDANGPLAAFVFKTLADPFVGKLSYFRVYSGTVSSHAHVWNSTKGEEERVAQVVVPIGKNAENVDTLVAGDIGAIAKLNVTATGDTLTTKEAGLGIEGITFPESIFSVSVEPKTKADLDKMGSALTRLLDEDPSMQMTREGDTHQVILSGMGDSHIDVAVQKLHRKFGVEVEVGTPKVPYKETIRVPAKAEYKHKKQTGGHGQYGHVVLQLEPLERGAGFEFGQKVVGGSVPKNFIPAVEKGIRETLPQGAVAHYPIVDVRATLVDGSFHAVDSSEMAFKIAASAALRHGIQDAQPVLLEPSMSLEIVCPDEFAGDVIGHLNSKRAHVLGMNTENGVTTVNAEAPSAEILRYSTELRSMTQGRGSYTAHFSHYDEVPAHLAQKIIEESNKEQVPAEA